MLEIEYSEEQRKVSLLLSDPIELPIKLFEIKQLLHNSPYKEYYLLEETVALICSQDWVPDTQPIVIAEARDAAVDIELSEDGMKALAHFHPAEGGDALTQVKIIDSLRKAKVYKGIRKRIINELIAHEAVQKTHVIATGQEPSEGSETQFETLVTPIQQRKLVPQMRDDGTMDMHDLGDIGTVTEDEPLLKRLPASAGENGYTVSGEVVFSIPPEDLQLVCGEGTKISPNDPNLLLASREGVPVEIDNGMKVDDILLVNKDADLSIGNIDYHGSVMIKGDVKEGMSIKSQGDIIVNGFVEPAYLEAKGSITIGQGVIGNQKEDVSETPSRNEFSAVIIAGGTLTARYAQHAFLKGGDVQLSMQILHCLVESDTFIQVGGDGQRNAKLVGGYLCAETKIAAGVIGAPSMTKTILDFSGPFNQLAKKRRSLNDQKKIKEEAIISIERSSAKLDASSASAGKDEKISEVTESEQSLNREIAALDAQLDILKAERQILKRNVSVKVFNKLYPGVEIRLADEVDVVREEHRAGSFRFEDDILVFDR